MSVKYAVGPTGSYRTVTEDMELSEDEVLHDERPDTINTPDLIASRRYRAEVSGVIVGGLPIFTDRTTQNKLTGAALRASRDTAYTVDWKCQDGTFITLTGEQIIEVADAVGDYVQACYSREASLLEALSQGIFTDEMLEEGWPSPVRLPD